MYDFSQPVLKDIVLQPHLIYAPKTITTMITLLEQNEDLAQQLFPVGAELNDYENDNNTHYDNPWIVANYETGTYTKNGTSKNGTYVALIRKFIYPTQQSWGTGSYPAYGGARTATSCPASVPARWWLEDTYLPSICSQEVRDNIVYVTQNLTTQYSSSVTAALGVFLPSAQNLGLNGVPANQGPQWALFTDNASRVAFVRGSNSTTGTQWATRQASPSTCSGCCQTYLTTVATTGALQDLSTSSSVNIYVRPCIYIGV